MTTDALAVEYVPAGDISPHPDNARRGDVDKIVDSMRTNGVYRPVIVQRSTGHIIAGNHTYRALLAIGREQIPVIYRDVDDETAVRIMLADNRTADLGTYDDKALLALLDGLADLDGTGYTTADLAELQAANDDDPVALTDPDDVPHEPRTPHTKVGQTWLLGPHRLTVGDSTDPGVVGEATGGRQAQLVLTDPPYNVEYVGKTKDALTIQNDSMSSEAFEVFLLDAYRAMLAHTIPGGPIYVFHADTEGAAFRRALVEAGWLLKQCLVWVKDSMVLSRQDYHWQHEPILYGWKPGAAHRWYGGFTPTTLQQLAADTTPAKLTKAQLVDMLTAIFEQSSVLHADRPTRSEDHPTSKPVALLTRLIDNSSQHGDLILDPFGGSGATLIAAHHTHRTAALVELDPRYADVICRRYQEHTNTVPVLEATGEPHDFTKD